MRYEEIPSSACSGLLYSIYRVYRTQMLSGTDKRAYIKTKHLGLGYLLLMLLEAVSHPATIIQVPEHLLLRVHAAIN